MAKVFDSITPELQSFIQQQHLFFVASAPLTLDGHINVSPKGLGTFRILSPQRVAYLDLTGSGNETSAHLAENGRVTLMFCSFEAKPCILRLYGKGQTVLPHHKDWDALIAHFEVEPGMRQIIVTEVHRVQTSCGFGVPLFDYQGQRDTLIDWAEKKGTVGLEAYRQTKNLISIDGFKTPLAQDQVTDERLLTDK
ncbi:MAG: pyridoxamine 5'-phosphate oxidase family protein [Cyanobacteria bacterium J06639_16]